MQKREYLILPKCGWHEAVRKSYSGELALFDWHIEFLVLVNASK